jgi:gluconokinase
MNAILLIDLKHAKGVSGTGKSTLGAALARDLSMPFIDGDDLHPKANVDKMASGQPLTDEDRDPWLELIRTKAEHMSVEQQVDPRSTTRAGVVVACSALKKSYRDILRGRIKAMDLPEHLEPPHPDILPTYFVFIKGEKDALMDRMQKRQGHFMKAKMLDSQLQTLESPEGEGGVVVVSMEGQMEDQVRMAREGLSILVNGAL